jgi:Protein of unknown function (DUF3433)
MLLALLISLLALIVGIGVLYSFAKQSRLYQSAFVYQASISILKTHLSTVAPFSIIPTLIAVAMSLWWGTIDVNFRRLQPVLSMSKAPTPILKGAGLSYQSSYWLWAAFKVLEESFQDLSTNWMYSAAIQMTINGSQPP